MMTLDKSTFAAALRMHRERLGITQREAAQLCAVSPRVWWQWENGAGTLAVTQEGVLARLKAARRKRS